LNGSLEKALASENTRKKLGQQGMQVVGGSPQALAELTRSEVERWAEVVRDSGAKLD
jgi:tripartite-type tricarboxylate transporter receptor subunit TctC